MDNREELNELRDEVKGLEKYIVELQDKNKDLIDLIEKMADAAYEIYAMK